MTATEKQKFIRELTDAMQIEIRKICLTSPQCESAWRFAQRLKITIDVLPAACG